MEWVTLNQNAHNLSYATHTCTYTHAHTHACTHACTVTHIYTHARTRAHTHTIYKCMHIHTSAWTCTHRRIFVHVHMKTALLNTSVQTLKLLTAVSITWTPKWAHTHAPKNGIPWQNHHTTYTETSAQKVNLWLTFKLKELTEANFLQKMTD